MKKYLIFLYILLCSTFAQTDWIKWEKKEVDYRFPVEKKRVYSVPRGNLVNKTFTLLKYSYWFLISDLDGDNCPYKPTCSDFFVESVKISNVLKGSLMFADRFTRDINLFKNSSMYPYKNGRLYDPPANYLNVEGKIKAKEEILNETENK